MYLNIYSYIGLLPWQPKEAVFSGNLSSIQKYVYPLVPNQEKHITWTFREKLVISHMLIIINRIVSSIFFYKQRKLINSDITSWG